MKFRTFLWLALIAALLLVGPVLAAAGLSMPRYHIAAGGGMISTGAYEVRAAIGQAVTGVGELGSYTLCAGFWCHAGTYSLYLPLVLKSF
jgi:hypothetical protein